jgi:hypothetical protein
MVGRIHPRRLAVAQRLRLFFAALSAELADGTDRIWQRVEARLQRPYPNEHASDQHDSNERSHITNFAKGKTLDE